MKKTELLSRIDRDLLDTLYGYCYRRTASTHEAQELCSDIVYELCRVGNSEGEIGEDGDEALFAFIWQVARHAYADFCERRSRAAAHGTVDDSDALLTAEDDSTAREESERDREALRAIYRRIANLTAAYRAVMIAYYLDGKSTRQIATELGIRENTVRQRLFSARETVRKEVTNMEAIKEKPTALQSLHFFQSGSGNPCSGDPRDQLGREISKHIVWLCRNRALTARQISDELNVPMLYIEDELRLLCRGEGSAKYAALRKTEDGKYLTNYILLSEEEFAAGRAHITAHLPALCDIITSYIEAHKQDYLTFPYRNHRVEWNSVIWQHINPLATSFGDIVFDLLKNRYLSDIKQTKRPFVIVGREMREEKPGYCGWDGCDAMHICGMKYVGFENLSTEGLRAHFYCAHNIARDAKLQLAIRAIDGLPVADLGEDEKETAAHAIREGLILLEGDTLYTRILVMDKEDRQNIFLLDSDIKDAMRPMAQEAARGIADWIRSVVPDHLLCDYSQLCYEVTLGVFTALLPALLDRGVLTLPEGGIGPEGCWMTVEE